MTANTDGSEEPKKARSVAIDAALIVTIAPLALALLRAALESRGDLSVMVAILNQANIVPIIGISILQTISLVFPVGIIFAAFGVFGKDLMADFFRRWWSWFVVVFGALLTLYATPWNLSVAAAAVAVVGVLINVVLSLIKLCCNAIQKRKLSNNKGDEGLMDPASGEDAEKLTIDELEAQVAEVSERIRKRTQRIVVVGAILIAFTVVTLPVPWSPKEQIALEGGAVVYGMVTASDGAWTTIVTPSNEIVMEKTSDIRRRIVCPRPVLAPIELIDRRPVEDRNGPPDDLCPRAAALWSE